MMLKNKYISILFCVSSGLNGENLGSDEHEVINICNIIIDVNKLKTVDILNYFIRPQNKFYNVISDDCKNLTGLTESIFEDSITLEEYINKFDKRLYEKNIHPNQIENEFTFLIEGPLHLRQLLIPECTKKNISLPFYYYSYFDLSKEISYYTTSAQSSSCKLKLNELINLMFIESVIESYSSTKCKSIEKIVYKMLENGHQFENAEVISKKLEHGICSVDDSIEENTIVRIRGLPWQCTDEDVSKFFAGLNIAEGGVALCLSPHGRRNGEALVRFVSEEHRNFALRRHKHHIGQRYIEVYRASGKEFINIAGGSNNEAKTFLSRNGKIIIRMRGLPFDADSKDVIEFFERGENPCEIVDNESGVLFVHYPDGRATGDAFVMAKDEDEAAKILLKHKETMGPRYIELFRSTPAEVQQVFKRSQDPKFYNGNSKDMAMNPLPILPPEMLSGGNKKDCIRLRNLPLDCGVEHILEFLGIHSQHIVHQGVHMILNAHGQPSGEAFIQFDSEQSSHNVATHKNSKCMYFSNKKYFIEVLQCSGEEMNLVLMGVLPSNLINFQAPHQPLNQFANNISRQSMSKSNLMSGSNMSINSFVFSNSHTPNLPTPTVVTPPSSLSLNLQNKLPSNLMYSSTTVTPTHIRGMQQVNLAPMHQHVSQSPVQMQNAIMPMSQSHQYQNTQNYPTPIIYWYPPYPTPPVSPSSTLYLAHQAHPGTMNSINPVMQGPWILILKGAPPNVTVSDIMQFFNGFEILPEFIQIQNSQDSLKNGINTSDAFVTFTSRSEAERALLSRNYQKIGNNVIELYIAV